MQNTQKFETMWAGKPLLIETGLLAQQAGGACTVTYGETIIMAAATISKNKREGLDFFPLMVEFEEKLYAAGKIKGSRFIKREGRPSDEAVLTGRMIDRALRPLFDDRIRNDVQVICSTLSYDPGVPVDVISLIAASCALHMSDVPWNGPLGGVRVGLLDDVLMLNPSFEQLGTSKLDLILSGTPDKVIMVECGAHEVNEDVMAKAFDMGREQFAPVIDLINEVRAKVGKEKKSLTDLIPEKTADVLAAEDAAIEAAKEIIKTITAPWLLVKDIPTKVLRKGTLDIVKHELKDALVAKELTEDQIKYAMGKASKLIEEEVSAAVLERERRVDGRAMDEIRLLTCQVNLLPRVHGSSLFSRGETQILSAVTLGAPGDAQIVDGLNIEEKKRYMHHYNFPPYSVGEVQPMRGTGRREVGHGALAEKALIPVLPSQEEFPYTIRVVSETLGSNGSSSMGSTCASTLALLAAGVPLKKLVAGIAMGVVSDEKNGIYKVITDLQDLEDGNGGMDFKITGTRDGITAIQLDTKTTGLPQSVILQTLKQSKEARMKILDVMEACLAKPQELSKYAPRIVSFRIDPEKIREVIGTGGKVINEIIDNCGGVSIDIEDDGFVCITGDMENVLKAQAWVQNIIKVPEKGEIYDGKVVRLMDFGAFVEILPGKDGMVHVSEIAWNRTNKPSDVLKVGDAVKVQVIEIDDMGRVNLSMKRLLPKPEGADDSIASRPAKRF